MTKIRAGFWSLAVAAFLPFAPSVVHAQAWTNWTSNTPGCDGGVANWCGDLGSIGVTYTGTNIGGQLSNAGTDYWSPTAAYTQNGLSAPDAGGNVGFIQFDGPVSGVINFSAPVENPYIAFISVGQGGRPVTYDFGPNGFSVKSNNDSPNNAYWGPGSYTIAGNTLTGSEFSGTIEFEGVFTSIAFTTNTNEYWHGISVGADGPEVAADVTGTPEPATLALVGTGLIGLVAVSRRRKRSV